MQCLSFVYELFYDGVVFYVGCTGDPYARYNNHRMGDSATSSLIQFILSKGGVFELRIAYVAKSESDACAKEKSLIVLYAKMGIELCNVDLNPVHNRLNCYYPCGIRQRKKREINKPLKNYIENVIKRYEEGKFRYECMGYATSIGRRIEHPGPKRTQLGTAGQNKMGDVAWIDHKASQSVDDIHRCSEG